MFKTCQCAPYIAVMTISEFELIAGSIHELCMLKGSLSPQTNLYLIRLAGHTNLCFSDLPTQVPKKNGCLVSITLGKFASQACSAVC